MREILNTEANENDILYLIVYVGSDAIIVSVQIC